MSKQQNALEFAAGAGVGTLIGLIAGLSASAIVSTVLAALSAGLLALLGIGKSSSETSTSAAPGSLATWRILGFGSLCSVCLVVGIFLRTHNMLAPSVKSEQIELEQANIFSKDEIHQIILLKQFGLSVPNGDTKLGVANPKAPAGIGPASGVLFAGKAEICNIVRRDLYPDAASYMQGLRVHGGDFLVLANAIERAPREDQDGIATALSNVLCK